MYWLLMADLTSRISRRIVRLTSKSVQHSNWKYRYALVYDTIIVIENTVIQESIVEQENSING